MFANLRSMGVTIRGRATRAAARIHVEIESIKMDAGYYATAEGYSDHMAYLRAIVGYIIGTARAIPCKIIGHDLEDQGHAGPEHGEIYMVCRRCGQSWQQTLY